MPETDPADIGTQVPRLKVLIAEDNAMNQKVIEGILGDEHDLTVCENGQEAVDAIGLQNFDLILMDMHMPVMDGAQATQTIRKTGSSIPIIALTADTELQAHQSFKNMGFDGLTLKPIKIPLLLQEIDRVMRDDRSGELSSKDNTRIGRRA